MSKYTKEEQTEIVRWALNLEVAIENEQKVLKRLGKEKYEKAPNPPRRRIVKQDTQPVLPDYSMLPKVNLTYEDYLKEEVRRNPTLFNRLIGINPVGRGMVIIFIMVFISILLMGFMANQVCKILAAIGFLLSAIILFVIYNCNFNKRTRYRKTLEIMNENIKRTPKYLQMKYQADMFAQQKQAEITNNIWAQQANYDEEYSRALENYELVVLPQYETAKAKWEADHNTMIQVVSDDLNNNIQLKTELYESTQLISVKLRSIDKLLWLYEDMSSSEHDIERSTDLLNAERLQESINNIHSSINRMHQNMMEGMSAIFSEVQYGNYVMEDLKKELVKTRVHLDLHAFASGIQTHNTNKQLKSMNKQFEELRQKMGEA